MKNIKSKLLSASVASLATMPLIASCLPTSVTQSLSNASNELYLQNNGQDEQVHQACTVAYLGKKCTADGKAYIARANDCSPKAHHIKLQHFKRDEIANKTLVGVLGFRYKMPEHTYAYTSSPLSDKAADNPTWGNGNWENNGINEMGVGVSATLTCGSCSAILNLPGESWLKEGVGEELFTQIMAAQAATAKEAMQVAAKAIDDYGAQDGNMIMAIDQNETWIMEIYSRHQYCAVKLPDDKVFIAGNEFILNSLADIGINESNKDDNCILSAGLLSVPKDNGLDHYRGDVHDIYHLDLFNTYAREGENGNKVFGHGAHMRTWRGYSLWDKHPDHKLPYSNTQKYEPFLTPYDNKGHIRNDMTVYDIMDVYKDEYDDIVDPTSENYDPLFKQLKDEGTLRTIAVQQTRQVHIMSSDPSKPKFMACNEWFTPDSANYVPFLQFNNAVTEFDDEYGYYPNRFEYDEETSSVLFRKINKLAWYDRTHYGYPLQKFWRIFEYIYCTQMQQVTNDAVKLSENDAKAAINNFNKEIRSIYIKQVKKTGNDLLWHIMDEPHSDPAKATFVPLIDLQQYVKELGWTDYHYDGKKVTFKKDHIKAEYELSSGAIYGKGSLTLSTGKNVQLRESVVDDKVYVDVFNLNEAIAEYSEIRNVNVNDYLNKFNHLVWIIPTVCALIIGAGLATFFIVRNKKKHHHKINKK